MSEKTHSTPDGQLSQEQQANVQSMLGEWANDLQHTRKNADQAAASALRSWSTFRDRILTLAAGSLPLSFLLLEHPTTPGKTELLVAAWALLSTSVAVCLMSIVFDWINARQVSLRLNVHTEVMADVTRDLDRVMQGGSVSIRKVSKDKEIVGHLTREDKIVMRLGNAPARLAKPFVLIGAGVFATGLGLLLGFAASRLQ